MEQYLDSNSEHWRELTMNSTMEVSMDKLKEEESVKQLAQHLGGMFVSPIEQYLDSNSEDLMDLKMD